MDAGMSSANNPYLYTGRRFDVETKWLYFRNRYYSPLRGRFVSRDSMGYVDGMNVYHGYFVPFGIDPFGLNIKVTFQLHLWRTITWIALGWNTLFDKCKDKKIIGYATGDSDSIKIKVDWVYQKDDPKMAGTKVTKPYKYKAELKIEFCGKKCTRAKGTFELDKVKMDYKTWKVKGTTGFWGNKPPWKHTLTEHSKGKGVKAWSFPFDIGDKKAKTKIYGPSDFKDSITTVQDEEHEKSGLKTREVKLEADWKIKSLEGFKR